MRIHHTDRDQIEMLKSWWKDYGRVLFIAVILGLSIGYGWHYWKSYRSNQKAEASLQYQILLNIEQQTPNNAKAITDIVEKLTTKYKSTPYASLGQLFLVKSLVNQNKIDEAVEKLSWILKNSKDNTFKQIARLQSARIYIEQNRAQEAINILKESDDDAYQPYSDYLTANAYRLEGNIQEANRYYQQALTELKNLTLTYSPLQMEASINE